MPAAKRSGCPNEARPKGRKGAVRSARMVRDRSQTTVMEYDKPKKNDVHPMLKPVEMLCYLVGNSSKRGEIILDTFGGSGSTLIACERTGRVCRTVELDPKYCDVIRQRWAEFVHGADCDWQSLTPVASDSDDGEAEEAHDEGA